MKLKGAFLWPLPSHGIGRRFDPVSVHHFLTDSTSSTSEQSEVLYLVPIPWMQTALKTPKNTSKPPPKRQFFLS
jgi:hypothetical protein